MFFVVPDCTHNNFVAKIIKLQSIMAPRNSSSRSQGKRSKATAPAGSISSEEITVNDCLFGRGGHVNHNPGRSEVGATEQKVV